MELDERGRGEQGAPLVGAPHRRRVGVHREGGVVEHRAVPARGQHHGVRCLGADVAGDEVPDHHPVAPGVVDDQVEHLVAGVQTHGARPDLSLQGLGAGDLELLPGLTPGVVGAGDLDAAERPGGQDAAVLAREGGADGGEVVDHPDGLLAQAERLGLAPAEVPALDGVGDEAGQGVPVDPAGARRVDPALRRHGVGATGGVVVGERRDLVPELAERGGRARTGQTGPHHHHTESPPVAG